MQYCDVVLQKQLCKVKEVVENAVATRASSAIRPGMAG